VTVLETSGQLVGPISVCPDVEEAWYKVINKESISRMEFFVYGGVKVQETADSVLVRWGSSGRGLVSVIPYTASGCPGEKIERAVTIELRIQVNEALGQKEVCFDPSVRFT
jgi:hypothetical protein